jgi:hypothetical protein
MLRWPDRRADLKRSAGIDAFLEMFSAYELACVAELHWANAPTKSAEKIYREYGLLIEQLEAEIINAITLN